MIATSLPFGRFLPEIADMQTTARDQTQQRTQKAPRMEDCAEIMIPLVAISRSFTYVKSIVTETREGDPGGKKRL
jgi:hypothetical protein